MTHPDATPRSSATTVSNAVSEAANHLGFFVCPAAHASASAPALRDAVKHLEVAAKHQGAFPLRSAIEKTVARLRSLDRRGAWTPARTARVAHVALGFFRAFGMPVPVAGRCALHGDACPTG